MWLPRTEERQLRPGSSSRSGAAGIIISIRRNGHHQREALAPGPSALLRSSRSTSRPTRITRVAGRTSPREGIRLVARLAGVDTGLGAAARGALAPRKQPAGLRCPRALDAGGGRPTLPAAAAAGGRGERRRGGARPRGRLRGQPRQAGSNQMLVEKAVVGLSEIKSGFVLFRPRPGGGPGHTE